MISFSFRALPALLVLLFSLPAFADNRSEAAEQIEKGNQFLEKGQYKEAITRFEIALKLAPELTSPYAGLGFAYQAMGRCEDALKYFQTYLTQNPSGSVAKEVKAASEECKATLYGTVIITSNPPGAAVYLGEPEGDPLGRTPYTADELKAGEYRLTLVMDGYEPWSMDLNITAGREYVIPEVALQKIGSNVAADPVEPVVIVKEAPLPALKRGWLGFSLSPLTFHSLVDNQFGSEDGGLLGLGLEISYLKRTAGQTAALGGQVSFKGGSAFFDGNTVFGVQAELGFAYHWQPALSKTKRERLDIGLEAGFQLGGPATRIGLFTKVQPGLAFHIGERGLFFFRPISVGLVDTFRALSVELLAFGYARGF